jgi:hypothetical protein
VIDAWSIMNEVLELKHDIEVPQDEAFGVTYTTLLESELKRLSDMPISGYERLVDKIKQTLEKNLIS